MPILLLILSSIAIQITVAILALGLIRLTRGRAAWILIATAISFMVTRRIIVLLGVLAGERLGPLALMEEFIALVVSVLMLFGVYLIGPLLFSLARSEEALRQSERKYRTLVDNLPQKIFLKDRNSAYVSCNPNYASDIKIAPEEIAGKTDYDFYPRELADKYRADDKRIMESGVTQDIEEKYVQDGREMIVHTVKTPIRDERGNVVGVLGIFWDITEQKRIEEAIKKLNKDLKRRTADLEAANKELEAFSYSVSHDLRAPLRSIAGFSQALLEDYGDKLDPQGKDYLERVRAGAQRMGQLIDDLLKLSRVTRAEMKRESVDMSTLAQEIAAELWKAQPEREVEFIIEPGMTANGDPHLLRIVLENLLSNAWKFTAPRPYAKIEFASTQVGGERVYLVRDNGVGFDMAYVGKLFIPFQRLHAPTEFPGTGIGLALVKRIIQRHGGRVWAEGEVDRGATFYFAL